MSMYLQRIVENHQSNYFQLFKLSSINFVVELFFGFMGNNLNLELI